MKASVDIVLPTTGEVVPFGRNLASGQANRTSLDLPEGLSFEDWAAIGDALSAAEQSVMWWIGDWWAYGAKQGYGERSDMLQTLLDAGHSPPALKTCANAGSISRRFPVTSCRREVLSWGHHAAVAALDDREADWMLDRAETSNWTRAELRDEVRRFKLAALRRPGERKYETQTIDDLHALVAAGQTFGTIYADPPWPYDNQATRGATTPAPSKNDGPDKHDKFHYENMSLEDICDLPVSQLTADSAHCHLWTTNGFLREAFDVMTAWGFIYKSCFVWIKPDFGIGNYWRVGHEFMLFGVKGKAPFRDNSQQSWLYTERGEHSAKPTKVRRIIEGTSPGPRLELFGRKEVENWTVWGNEIERIIDATGLFA